MRVTVTYRYKNYPNAPDLTKKSQDIAVLTKWYMCIIYPIPFMILPQVLGLELLGMMGYTVGIVLTLILLPGIRKRKIRKLDEEYARRQGLPLSALESQENGKKKKTPLKTAAIVLFVFQGLSLFGALSSGSFFRMLSQAFTAGAAGISQLFGYFLPSIIGFILLGRHKKKQAAMQKAQQPGQSVVSQKPPVAPVVPAKPPVTPVVPPKSPVTPVVPAKPRSVLLTLTTGPRAGTAFRAEEGTPVTVGRSPSRCNLILSEYPSVSGQHCRFDMGSSGLTITDLGSTNGTFVNGVRLTPNQPASAGNGAEIRLANQGCVINVKYQ